MSIVQAPELDYRPQQAVNPTYRDARVVQKTGGLKVSLNANGTQESLFDIPSKCWNQSNSKVAGNLHIKGTAAKAIVLYNKGFPLIDTLQFRTRGGTTWVDVTSSNVVSAALSPYHTKLTDMLDADTVNGEATTLSKRKTRKDAFVNRSNTSVLTDQRLISGAYADASLPYTEVSYLIEGTSGALGVGIGADVFVPFEIPLSEFKNSWCSDVRDSYFPEVIEMRILWSRTTAIGFEVDNLDAPTSTTSIAGDVTIEDLYFYQALQVDPNLCNDLVRRTNAGSSMLIPYTYVYREPYNGETYNRSHRWNQAHGQSILRIYNFNTHPTESNEFAYDIDNSIAGIGADEGRGSQVTSFFTTMDNLRQTEFDLECGAVGTDYMVMKPLLKESCIQNKDMYNHNRVFCESFDYQRLSDTPMTDSIKSGLSLVGVEREYAIQQKNTDTGRKTGVNYTVLVTQKVLTQQAGQIIVV